jgi:predicted short-subunit dehydrogenase-like oxidoreductase (DUF2520 family)
VAAEDLRGTPLSAREPLAIVGAGRVAQALGRALQEGGERVIAVGSRSPRHAEQAAAFIGPGVRATDLRSIPALASTWIIAVSDTAIGAVAAQLAERDVARAIALHTCGALGPAALAPLAQRGAACGVFHPLQTIASPEQGAAALAGVTFGIAGDERAVAEATRLAHALEGRPMHIRPSAFPLYHAAAVMASNHMVAVIDAAVDLLVEAGVARAEALDALAPLCRVTLANVLANGTSAALTGPAVRGDAVTIGAHVAALQPMPELLALYRAASHRLLGMAGGRGLNAAAVQQARDVLGR